MPNRAPGPSTAARGRPKGVPVRIWKRIVAIAYLLVCIVVLGGFGFLVFGPYQAPARALFEIFGVRIAAAVCLAVIAIYSLVVVLRLFFKRPDPTCIHPDGNPDVQITKGALRAVVEVSAKDDDLLIEDIDISIKGRDHARAKVRIQAICLTNHDASGVARRVQERVAAACQEMLGASGVSVQVRFLPSKTETFIKEASGE